MLFLMPGISYLAPIINHEWRTTMLDRVAEELGVSTIGVVAIAALLVVQAVLVGYSLYDLAQRDRVAGDKKWLWVLIILAINPAGALIYLFVGRNVPPMAETADLRPAGDPLTERERIRRGVDALYGPVDS